MPSDDRAVTLQDIADRLGVSRSTASFAITGRGRVSAEMRRRVLEVADELGYRPNTVARNLRGARTGMLALRLPPHSTSMAYYMEAAFGAVEEAAQAGVIVFLLTTDPEVDSLDRLPADAVIILDPALDDPVTRALLRGRVPVITGEPVPDGLPAGRGEVTSDHAPAVRELLDHLAERGARRPAVVFPALRNHWAFTVRDAIDSWCAEHGIRPRIAEVPHPAEPAEIQAAVAEIVLDDDDEPADAIIAVSDGTVLSVVTSAQRLGRRVGEDLLVASLVDSDVLALAQPSITAIDLHPREFGRRCARAALAAIEADADGEPIHEVVPVSVQRRASTLGPATDGAPQDG
ncbi:LacI family DNA-binding transcriptional regulator [Microbacterium sp.]|uniref:LacI family DNA-binding transcriptional regulator n=1 Tax=Microbacterium sp. TaxID=51671 RepID=UPI00281170BC|nr:LacI family DNA-binding transcriptional regulator [Microbacterium sp.]